LRTSLATVDDLVGMKACKQELAYTLQTLLSYKKLEQPPVMTMKTRGGGRGRAPSPPPTPKRARRERTDSESGAPDVCEEVRQEVAKTLARLLTAADSDSDYEEEDEEEYDEPDIPKALRGEKMHCLIASGARRVRSRR
jgi:hypothetical protein